MVEEFKVAAMTLLPFVLQLAGMTFAVAVDPYIQKRQKTILLVNVAVIFCLLAQNYVGYLLDVNGQMIFARIVVGIVGYCLRPVVIVLFVYMVTDNRKIGLLWILIGANALIHITALFSDVCFTIDASNRFHRGPLGYSCHITSALCLVILIYYTIRKYKGVRFYELLIPLINAVLIATSVVVDSFVDYRVYRVTYMTMAVVSCSLFYYIWLHLQFAREHEKAMQAEQRIQIMMSQIQPHFLYNTLSTIQALCRTNPEKAFDTTEKFGTYLRQNINSLNQTGLIPLKKELEHVRVYAEIEEVRFPNIRVTYDVKDADFSLPALSVQPLVENAIRHGVRIRKDGVVTISTRLTADCHEIVIADNGKGFDVKLAENTDETHIGIRNVRERLEKMCHGTLDIASVLDEGTTITIRIPV